MGLTSPFFLRKRLAALRGPGRAGAKLLDRLMLDSGGHSPLERAFLRLVRLAGLPTPTFQRRFTANGRTAARVDFCFEPPRVVVEVSGQRGHSSPSERAKDAQRRNELQSQGFVVLEFTYDDVAKRPTYVLAMLRGHLG
jgi:very-short-patch-repair endonuclease